MIMLAWPADMPYYETLRQAPSTRSAPSVWTQTRLVAMESSSYSDRMYSRLLRAAAQHQSPVSSLVDANGRCLISRVAPINKGPQICRLRLSESQLS